MSTSSNVNLLGTAEKFYSFGAQIDALQRHGVIRDDDVAAVMKVVDRADFCKHDPYGDCPQSIGFNVTIR